MENKDLVQLSGRIAILMQSVPNLRDPLDYLIGALYALFIAEDLGYQDREFPLPADYWNAPLLRAQAMAIGGLRKDGKWAAGFYFNSALLRIAASYHRVLRILTREDGYVPKLLKVVIPPFHHDNLDAIHCEVNNLKHAPSGVEQGRKVSFASAIEALRELVDFVDSRQADF